MKIPAILLAILAAAAALIVFKPAAVEPTAAPTAAASAPPKADAPVPDVVTRAPRLRITDATGRPVEGARVTAAVSTDYFKSFDRVEAVSGADGGCDIDLPARAWVVLNVNAAGLAPQASSLTEPDPGVIAVALSPGVALEGRLTTRANGPAARARLRFEPVIPQAGFTQRIVGAMALVDDEVVTDENGRFRCAALRPTDYRVVFADTPDRPARILRAADIRKGDVSLKIN